MRRIACALALAALLTAATRTAGAAAPAPDFGSISHLADHVDHRYNSLKTLEAHFVEIYSEGNQSRTESGTLYLRKPGRMRWQYEQPQKKLFLVDGHHVWLYVEGDQQAQRSDLKNSEDLKTPLRFLLGHTHLKKELAGLSYGGLNPLHAGDAVIRGVPTRMTDQYREVILEVSPTYQINRIVIRGVDGSQTDIRLSGMQPNTPIAESLFHFVPPKGVAIVAGAAE